MWRKHSKRSLFLWLSSVDIHVGLVRMSAELHFFVGLQEDLSAEKTSGNSLVFLHSRCQYSQQMVLFRS